MTIPGRVNSQRKNICLVSCSRDTRLWSIALTHSEGKLHADMHGRRETFISWLWSQKKRKKRWSHTISVESKNIYDLKNSHQTLTSKYLPTNSTFMEPKTQHRELKDLNHSMGLWRRNGALSPTFTNVTLQYKHYVPTLITLETKENQNAIPTKACTLA